MSALESRPALHALLYARRNYHIRVPHPLPPPFIYFIYAPPPPEFRSIRSSLSIVRSWRIENSRSVLPIGFIFISFHLCCLHGDIQFFPLLSYFYTNENSRVRFLLSARLSLRFSSLSVQVFSFLFLM